MKSGLLFVSLLLILPQILRGNGGPIDASALYRTGNIVPLRTTSVSLLSEQLSIYFEDDYAFVKAVYKLKNTEAHTTRHTYGFPVDFGRNILDYDETSDHKIDWKSEYLPEFSFHLNGNKIEYQSQVDWEVHSELLIDDRHESDFQRKWFVTHFELQPDSVATLIVQYKVLTSFEDYVYSKSFVPSYSLRRFIYDFRPASLWGDSTVDTLHIHIDVSDIVNHGEKITYTGPALNLGSTIYGEKFTGQHLGKLETIVIDYTNDNKKLSSYIPGQLLYKKRF